MSRVDESSFFYATERDPMTETPDEVEVWEAFSRSDVAIVRAVNNGTDVRAFVNPRALRDALSAHLGDTASATPAEIIREARERGYQDGVEAGTCAARAAVEVHVPRIVTAVEVEIFREAFAGASDRTWDLHDEARVRACNRTALEAVEDYRAWKAAQA